LFKEEEPKQRFFEEDSMKIRLKDGSELEVQETPQPMRQLGPFQKV